MKITIQTPGFKVTEPLQKFVVKNVNELEVYYNQIIEAQVCLRIGNAEKENSKVCELKLIVPGNDLFASKHAATFEESLVIAIDAIKHQIEKIKTKRERQRTA